MLLLKYISLICLVALPILYTASWVGIISPPKFISPAKFIELAVIFTFDISPLSIFTFEINWLFAFIATPNVEIVISPFTVTPVKFPLTMFTFENAWVLQSIAPNNFEISISDIVPPPITSPVNWFGANTIFAALKSIVEPEINSILNKLWKKLYFSCDFFNNILPNVEFNPAIKTSSQLYFIIKIFL